MLRKLSFIVVALSLLGGLASCGNSEESCTEICEWWDDYCTGVPFSSCMDDCQSADEDADSVISRCVDGEGWSEPSSCQSASCCVRFVYWEDDYAYQCL